VWCQLLLSDFSSLSGAATLQGLKDSATLKGVELQQQEAELRREEEEAKTRESEGVDDGDDVCICYGFFSSLNSRCAVCCARRGV
jgi:hypothetical protein